MTRLLLDTASLYFRAYFGVPDSMRAADGVRPVNAVRGLLDMIARFVTLAAPDELVACWDNDWRPPWRVALIDTYKTHRVAPVRSTQAAGLPVGAGGRGADSGLAEVAEDGLAVQVPMIRDVLGALGIAVVGVDGYEADDVIGTLAATAPGRVEVVTGDRDLFQLVDDRTVIRYVARGVAKHEIVDDSWLAGRYGIIGAQYVDFAVLRGDPSDGLPGVPGIGEKTAASLLATHGDLASAMASGVSGSVGAKLAASRDYIEAATQVVAVRRDLPIPDVDLATPRVPADPARFADLSAEFDLGGSADRLLAALAARPS